MSEQTALQKALWDALMACRRLVVKDMPDMGITWRWAKVQARTKDVNVALSTNPGTQLTQTPTGIVSLQGYLRDGKWAAKGTKGTGQRIKDLLLGNRTSFEQFVAKADNGCDVEMYAVLTFMSRSHQNNIQLCAGYSLISAFGSKKALCARLTELYNDEAWAECFSAICYAQYCYVSKLYEHDGGKTQSSAKAAESESYTMQSVYDAELQEAAKDAKENASE